MSDVTPEQFEHMQKAIYAAGTLLPGVFFCIHASVLTLLLQITPVVCHRSVILGMSVFVLLWFVASTLAACLVCEASSFWRILEPACAIMQPAFWTAFASVNIAVEIALFCLAVYIVLPLNMKRSGKNIVIIGFASRIL